MREEVIKKLMIFVIGLFVTGVSVVPALGGSAPGFQNTTIRQADGVTVSVQSTDDTTTLHYSLDAFSSTPVLINDQQYSCISLGKEPNSLIAGAPDLPSISRSIIIPEGATMKVRVLSSSYQEYKNIFVVPSKGNLERTVNPADVPYVFGDIYQKNTWYPSSLVELQEPYYLRDFRGQVVTIHPFQYNPSQATLRFYSDITVQVSPVTASQTSKVTPQTPMKIDSTFMPIYRQHFLNFETLRYDPVPEIGNMLVITYDAFHDAMVPFVEWKNMKGIPTEMVDVSTIGNAQAIKSFIADYYNAKGLTFVLLVGDAAQVPTLYSGAASDPSYTYIVGNDHYPDLFIGRFSAETIAQVGTQVNRTIAYERDPQPDVDWYKKGIGIGSQEGQGMGDDNEIDYQHIRNIRTLLLNFTYSTVNEFYDGNQGGEDAPGNPSPSMISSALNEGRSIINYCGHGSMTSWGTSGFSNSNVNSLTNDNMLPFIISVACSNGEFDAGTCFGEAWLRATHNNQPTGAIATYMSSKIQNWAEPMEAQDEINNILVGKYTDNKRFTFGALCFEGAMAMNDKYGSSGAAETDAWTVFGDPSVQVRTDIPATLTVTHDASIPYGAQTFEFDIPGFTGALGAISNQGVLLGTGYTDETGHAAIQFYEPINFYGDVQLVITGFNTMPYVITLTVQNPNSPPDKPTKPTGEANGNIGTLYNYSTVGTDPDGDQLYYMWDWGDGNFSAWLGPYDSGATATAQYSWAVKGSYSVKVKAKDTQGNESVWSDPADIKMPYATPFLTQLLHFLETFFPHLFHFFEKLLKV